MKTWRLEHPAKETFFEVFWDGFDVEVASGAIGKPGRTRAHKHASISDAEKFVAAELAKRHAQGFVEVAPEVPIEQARTAPIAPPAPALLDEIRAHPDDDAPRLVYADYLMGHGDPLGELIAVQCEAARLDRWDRKRPVLLAREEFLLLAFRPRWLGTIARHITATFVRGFVDRIAFEGGDARERVLDRALAIAPLLTTLEIPSHLDPRRAGTDEGLAQLTGLVLDGAVSRGTFERWMLPGLVRLTARGGSFASDPMRGIAARAWRELAFESYALGVNGTNQLLERIDGSALERLSLVASGVTDAGVAKIAARALPRLRVLELRGSSVTARGLEALAGATDLGALARLDVSANREAGAGVPALASGGALPGLRELALRHVTLDADDIAALARSPLGDRLVSLDVEGCGLDATAAESLVDGAWPALRELRIHGNPLGDGDALIRARFGNIHVSLRGPAG